MLAVGDERTGGVVAASTNASGAAAAAGAGARMVLVGIGIGGSVKGENCYDQSGILRRLPLPRFP